MKLLSVLSEARAEILGEVTEGLNRSHAGHYETSGAEGLRVRLESLFDTVVAAIRDRKLDQVIKYAEHIGRERFASGFGIEEVQTAFNVLEESMWRHVAEAVPAKELVESLGLLSTVLGVGKDALARTYVSLASHEHVPSLDLRALFQGT
ncbi:MAG: hypothetical protein ABR925_05595 [Acidimicrobiales bacterium]|jgi:hypothetical protein